MSFRKSFEERFSAQEFFVVVPGVEGKVSVEAIGSLGGAPGFAKKPIDIGSKHGAGVV